VKRGLVWFDFYNCDLLLIQAFLFSIVRDFIQAKAETNVKTKTKMKMTKEEQSKRAIPGVTKYLAALRHAQGAYLIAGRCRELCSAG
jgi:hypothetical protein